MAREPQRSASARGYTYRWAQASKRFRSRYPLCGMRPGGVPPVMSRCHDQRRLTVAALVDHVVPHRGDQVLFWDEGNWQSMCHPCHNWKTLREDGGRARPRLRRDTV